MANGQSFSDDDLTAALNRLSSIQEDPRSKDKPISNEFESILNRIETEPLSEIEDQEPVTEDDLVRTLNNLEERRGLSNRTDISPEDVLSLTPSGTVEDPPQETVPELTKPVESPVDRHKPRPINTASVEKGDSPSITPDAYERASLAVEQAFRERARRQAKSLNFLQATPGGISPITPGIALELGGRFGRGVLGITASLAELAGQLSPDPLARKASKKASDFLNDLIEGANVTSDETLMFQQAQEEAKKRLAENSSTSFKDILSTSVFRNTPIGAAAPHIGEFLDNVRNEVSAFTEVAQDDPAGAFRYAAGISAEAMPSLGATIGANFVGGPPAMLFMASAMESGANLSEAARDPQTGERREVDIADIAIALAMGVAAGSLEALSAGHFISRTNALTKASPTFQALSPEKKAGFWRSLSQGIRNAAKNAVEEPTTEVLQNELSNAAARFGWNPEQEFGEGALESAIGGFGVAVGSSLPANVLSTINETVRRRAEGRPDADPVPLEEAPQPTDEAVEDETTPLIVEEEGEQTTEEVAEKRPQTPTEETRSEERDTEVAPDVLEVVQQVRTEEEIEQIKAAVRAKLTQDSKVVDQTDEIVEELPSGEADPNRVVELEVPAITDEQVDERIEELTTPDEEGQVTQENIEQAVELDKTKRARQQLEQVPEKREAVELTPEEIFEKQQKLFPQKINEVDAANIAADIDNAINEFLESNEDLTEQQIETAIRQDIVTDIVGLGTLTTADLDAIIEAADDLGIAPQGMTALELLSQDHNELEIAQITEPAAEPEVAVTGEPVVLPDAVVDAFTRLDSYRNTIPSNVDNRSPSQKGQVTRRRNKLVAAIEAAGLDVGTTVQQLENSDVEVTRESDTPQPTIEEVEIAPPTQELVDAQDREFPLQIDRDAANVLADSIIKEADQIQDATLDNPQEVITLTVEAIGRATQDLTVNDLEFLSESLANQNATDPTLSALARVIELRNDLEIGTLRRELGEVVEVEVPPVETEPTTTPQEDPTENEKVTLSREALRERTPFKQVAQTKTDRLKAVREILRESGFNTSKFSKIYEGPWTETELQDGNRNVEGRDTSTIREAVNAITKTHRFLEVPVFDNRADDRVAEILIEFTPDLSGVRALIDPDRHPHFMAELSDREIVVVEEVAPETTRPRPGSIPPSQSLDIDEALADMVGEEGETFFGLDVTELAKRARQARSEITENDNVQVTEDRAARLREEIAESFEEDTRLDDDDLFADFEYRDNALVEPAEESAEAIRDLTIDAPQDFIYEDVGTDSPLKILGRGIGNALKRKGTTSLIGKVVQKPEDVATLAQVYRDKRFETSRFFFIKDGKIVGETAISSRMAESAPAFAPRDIVEIANSKYAHITNEELKIQLSVHYWLQGLMSRYEADSFYGLHNHPSGDVRSSQADLKTTALLYAVMPDQFLGNIIIDTGKASIIERQGDMVKRREFPIEDIEALEAGGIQLTPEGELFDTLADPLVPSPLIGITAASPGVLAAISKEQTRAMEEKDAYVIIGTNIKHQTVLLAALPKSALIRPPAEIRKLFATIAARHGVTQVYLGNASPREMDLLQPLVKVNIVNDILDTHRRSMVRDLGVAPDPERRRPSLPYEVRLSDVAADFVNAKWEDAQGRPRHTEQDVTLSELESNNNYDPENAEKTQIRTTEATYRKFDEFIRPGDKILDYGGGLGFGTLALREMGHDVSLFEPFSNPDRRATAPDFIEPTGSDITGKYDVILSSAVLNVVPQDIRTSIIEKMGELLNVGGQILITARGWRGDVQNAARNGTELGNRQVITSRGTYQKGFTFEELATEVQDVLGPDYQVHSFPLGNVGVRVEKVRESALQSATVSRLEEALGLEFNEDPDVDRAAIEYMVYHIERGVQDLATMTRIMVDEFGEGVLPNIEGWYKLGLAKIHDRGIPVQVLATSPLEISTHIKKGSLTKASNPRNADRNLSKLDVIKGLHEDPDGNLDILASEESWITYMTRVKGDTSVPVPPYKAIEYFNDAKALKNVASRISPNQKRLSDRGLKATEQVGEAYRNGEVSPEITLQYILWGILSRGQSPYPHESAFIDAILDKGQYFIDKAMAGKFDETEYLKWSNSALKGLPGAGGTSNLNSFGKSTLTKMLKPIEADNEYQGRRPIDVLHELLSSDMSGRQIRREFFRIVEKPGIDNKVFSFLLLLTGRHDVIVLDRVQINHLWGVKERQSQFMTRNAYDGYKLPRGDQDLSELSDEILEEFEEGDKNSSGLFVFVSGIQGLAIYEAIEESLESKIREAGFNSLGDFHWQTWVLESGQEVDHRSIESLGRAAIGEENAFEGVSVRQGKYDSFHYDTVYGILDGERVHVVTDSTGNQRVMTLEEYDRYFSGLQRMNTLQSYFLLPTEAGWEVLSQREANALERKGQGADLIFADDTTGFSETEGTVPRIFPSDFKVSLETTEDGTQQPRKTRPWRLDDTVSQGALDNYIQGFGREITAAESSTLSGVTDESRQGRTRRRRLITKERNDRNVRRLTQLSAQVSVNPFGNPEVWRLLLEIGVFYAQEATITFGDWLRTMREQIGDLVDDDVLTKLWVDIQKGKESLAQGATFDEVAQESVRQNVTEPDNAGKEERNFSRRFRGDEEAGRIRDDIDEDIQRVFRASVFRPISNQATVDKIKDIVDTQGIDAAIGLVKSGGGNVIRAELSPAERVALANVTLLRMNAEIKKLEGSEDGDKAQRDKLLLQTVDLAEFVAEFGTELGRGLQAYTIWARLTPEALVLRFNKLQNQSQIAKRNRNERKDQKILESVEQANDQAASSAVNNKSKDIADIIERASKRLAGKIKPTFTPKQKDVIDFYVHTLFEVAKERGTNVEVGDRPTPDTPIEKLGQVVRAFKDLSDVWTEAQEIVATRFSNDPMSLQALNGFLQRSITTGVSNRVLTAAIRQGLREKIIPSLRELAQSHWTKVDAAGRTLAQKIVDEAGIPESEAQLLAEIIQNEFEKIVDERRETILRNRVGKLVDREKKPLSKTKSQSFYDELFRVANLGAVSPEQYNQILEEFYGFKGATPEQIETIRELADLAQQAPEGDLQAHRSVEIAAYMARETGIPWTEFLQSYWYANVLSGVGTATVNIWGSVQNILFRKIALNLTKQGRKHKRAVRRGLKIGSKQGRVAATQALRGRIVTKAENKFEVPRALEIAFKNLSDAERAKTFSVKKLFLLGRWIGRELQAADIYFHRMAREAQAYLVASQEVANLDNGNLTEEEFIRLVDEEVNHTEEKATAAREQAEREVREVFGEEATENDIEQRMWEILEQSRDEENRILANQFGSLMNFTSESRGSFGMIGDILTRMVTQFTVGDESQEFIKGKILDMVTELEQKIANEESLNGLERLFAPRVDKIGRKVDSFKPGGIPLLRPIVPFIPILANVFNRQIDFMPVIGHLRAYRQGSIIAYGRDKQIWTDTEQNLRLAEANIAAGAWMLLGAVAIASLAVAGDDEEPFFWVYGAGPKDWRKRSQWLSQGNREFTLKVGDIRLPYKETNMAFALGVLGNYLDFARETGDWGTETISHVLMAFPEIIVNASFLQAIGDIYDLVAQADNKERIQENTTKLTGNWSSGLVPGIGLLRDMSALFDPAYRRSNTFVAEMLKGVPVLKNMVGLPMLNALGEEVTRKNIFNRLPGIRRFLSVNDAGEEWEFLARHKVWVPTYGGQEVNIVPPNTKADSKEGRQLRRMIMMGKIQSATLTDEEMVELTRITGERVKQQLRIIMESGEWEGKSVEYKQESLDKIARQAKSDARRIFMFGEGAVEKSSQWKLRWEARKRAREARRERPGTNLTQDDIERLIENVQARKQAQGTAD